MGLGARDALSCDAGLTQLIKTDIPELKTLEKNIGIKPLALLSSARDGHKRIPWEGPRLAAAGGGAGYGHAWEMPQLCHCDESLAQPLRCQGAARKGSPRGVKHNPVPVSLLLQLPPPNRAGQKQNLLIFKPKPHNSFTKLLPQAVGNVLPALGVLFSRPSIAMFESIFPPVVAQLRTKGFGKVCRSTSGFL